MQNKKIRVLFVSEYFSPKIMGGGEINLFLLAKALTKRNIDVYILTSHFKKLKRYEEMGGIKIYRRLKTSENVSGIIGNLKRSFIFPSSVEKEIIKLEKEINIDVVHFIGTSIIAAKKLNLLGKPLFATIESYPTLCPKGDRIYNGKRECKFVCSFKHFIGCQLKSPEIGKMKNGFYLKYNPLFLAFLYSHYKRLNNSLKYCNLIAISEYVKKILFENNLKSQVIPNAIDINQFKDNTKKYKSNKLKIVYLGSLTKYKGPHILLKAINGLDCRCDLYGEGVMKDELNKIIGDCELDAEIHALVPYEKVHDIYAGADIVVFPSIWPEPFGRIPIEAMAAGKPVIGSEIGGIKETLDKSGLLFEPGNIRELRNAIIKLKDNKYLIKEISEKGKKSVGRYEERKVTNELTEAYLKAIK